MADTLFVNRARLNDTLNNKPGYGGQTRKKVVALFDRHLPEHKRQLISALGWTETGGLVPHGTKSDTMEQSRFTGEQTNT